MSNLIHNLVVDNSMRVQLVEKISLFRGKKILVIGDVGVDEYIMGAVKRISPEAPVPVLEVDTEDKRLGLAANVAQNVVSLGGSVELLSVIGSDAGSAILSNLLQNSKVPTDGLILDLSRSTTRKTRIMTGQHHLVRIDHEIRRVLSDESEAILLEKLKAKIDLVDVIILEDYAKGIFTKSLVEKIVTLAKDSNTFLMADPHQTKFADFYKGVDLIKPNYNEALALTRIVEDEIEDPAERVLQVGRALQKMTGAGQVVLTQGQSGMTIFSQDKVTRVPTFAKKVFDVTGAGDTVIAALALGVAAGLSLNDACMIANFAAGVVVGKIGCVPCETADLISSIQSMGL